MPEDKSDPLGSIYLMSDTFDEFMDRLNRDDEAGRRLRNILRAHWVLFMGGEGWIDVTSD